MSKTKVTTGSPAKSSKQENFSGQTAEQLQSRLDNINERLEKAEARERDQQNKLTELLAILFGLFTFISVNISVFSKIDNMKVAVWFMILMTICLILMISFLIVALKIKEESNKTANWVLLVSTIAVLILILFTTKWNNPLSDTKNKVEKLSSQALFQKNDKNPEGMSSINLMEKLNQIIDNLN
ncbi:MAG: hypothetical protein WA051_01280 [Minisyncoccia bacterium]